jgi:mRNA interferase RelE/StbE
MNGFSVRYTRSAEKDLQRLPASVVERVQAAILDLAADPRPRGSKKLKGYDDTWRIRVGDYRVLYEIHEELVVVLIVQVSHRKDAYR